MFHLALQFALGAQPLSGFASRQALVGQCAESVFRGSPTLRESAPRPYCKGFPSTGELRLIKCRGI